jgi:anti-anti-sigma factor
MEPDRVRPPVVTVVAGRGSRSASIRLVGDMDMLDEPALADAVDCLLDSQPEVVVVDLSAVTFVCSTFANFVADVHAAVPGASLILRHPSRMARRVLAITGLDTLVTIPDDAGSAEGCEPHSADRGPVKGDVSTTDTVEAAGVRVGPHLSPRRA